MHRNGRLDRLAAFTIAILVLGLVAAHTDRPTALVVAASAAEPTGLEFARTPAPAAHEGARPTRGTSPPDTAAATTTTVATTTTQVPPPPVTSPPAPPSTPTSAPPPPPATSPPPPPPPAETLQERVERAYVTGVPAMWRNAIAVELTVIDGTTSWAEGGGAIRIARSHAEARFEHLVDVVAHEFGHQVAFEFGSGEYAGAAPTGWPAPATNPAEAWADCVQSVFTGRSNPSHGLAPCGGEQLAWAAEWLQAVPPPPSA